MNDFTKEELIEFVRCLDYMIKGGITPYSTFTIELLRKTKYVVDNYDSHNAKWIAKAHLIEAASLIDHAMCLLGLDNDNQ